MSELLTIMRPSAAMDELLTIQRPSAAMDEPLTILAIAPKPGRTTG